MALRRELSEHLYRYSPSRFNPMRRFIHGHGFFRRCLQHNAVNDSYKRHVFPIPINIAGVDGEILRNKPKSLNIDRSGDQRVQIDGSGFGSVSLEDTKRILRFIQLQKLRERLRNFPDSTISYSDFLGICVEVSGGREDGFEYAKALDESGNVIVFGGIVLLRPDQVAKSMEKLISQEIGLPNDPRRKELDRLENQKAQIDRKAQALVRGELYCGLGFLVLQTLGFMRLTFWELTWDVMEPICFFATSLHFALGYAFFLKTSNEPTFQGYFQRRFKAKQTKLMKIHNFDVQRYNQLCQVFYPGKNCRIACFGSIHGNI